MGGEGCFWKPFRVAGMCVEGGAQALEGKRDQRPCQMPSAPACSPSFLSVARPFAVAQSGLTEAPAPHVLGRGSPGFLRKGR